MQVINYQTPPIFEEPVNIPLKINDIDSIQQQITQPIIDVINNTLEAVNETIKQTIEKIHAQRTLQSLPQTHFEDEWNFLYFIRILFYFVVIMKVIELVFSKRRKMDIQQRVYRKYIFSHGEMIRQFNQDDRKIMDTTLKNTIKNATIDKSHPKAVKKTTTKKVIFYENKNQYIEPPKKDVQNTEDLSPLQVFLSRPVKVQPVHNERQQEPQQRQFQIIETINQSTQVDDQSGIFFQHEKGESSITQTTAEGSVLEPIKSYINHPMDEHVENIEINA